MMTIKKEIVHEEAASPYQGYPQMGDTIYVISPRDNRRAIIAEWCEANVVYGHHIFNWTKNKTALWIADDIEIRRFEEWLNLKD